MAAEREYTFPYIIDPKPELERQRKFKMRKFWVLGIPLGAVIGLVASLIFGGAVFLPVWGISAILFVCWDDRPGDGQNQ